MNEERKRLTRKAKLGDFKVLTRIAFRTQLLASAQVFLRTSNPDEARNFLGRTRRGRM
jgi:hypothetical protein